MQKGQRDDSARTLSPPALVLALHTPQTHCVFNFELIARCFFNNPHTELPGPIRLPKPQFEKPGFKH